MILGLLYAGRWHGILRVSQTSTAGGPKSRCSSPIASPTPVPNPLTPDSKQIKRTGRGHRKPARYQVRILLISAAPRAACAH